MRRQALPLRILCGLVLILGVGVSPLTAQAYKGAYTKGVKAVDRSDWAEVAAAMREAIAAEPTASTKKIKLYGTRFVPYLPYYHLGLALANLGDCEGALAAWQRSEAQGAVQEFEEYEELQRLRDECRAQLPPPSPTPVPPTPTPAGPDPAELLQRAREQAQQALDAAEAAARVVRLQRRDQELARLWQSEAQLQRRFDRAEEALATARRGVDAGVAAGDPEAVRQAAAGVVELESSYKKLAGDVSVAKKRLDRTLEQQRQAEQAEQAERRRLAEELREELAPANEALTVGAALSSAGQRSVRGLRQTLEEVVARALAAADNPQSATQLEVAREELERATAAYRGAVNRVLAEESKPVPPTPTPRPTRPPTPTPEVIEEIVPLRQTLERASEAFLEGDYETPLELLHDLEGSARELAVAHLVRAAALYYQFEEGGRAKAELREQAAADVAFCREADSGLAPDARFFSPSFTAFFSDAGSQ